MAGASVGIQVIEVQCRALGMLAGFNPWGMLAGIRGCCRSIRRIMPVSQHLPWLFARTFQVQSGIVAFIQGRDFLEFSGGGGR